MTKDESLAFDLALEALELLTDTEQTYEALDLGDKAITAIKQARSAPVREPDAFDCGVYLGAGKDHAIKHHVSYKPAQQKPDHGDELTIAYMSGVHRGKELAAQRQWTGLTEQQKQELAENWFAEDWAITKAIGMMYDHETKLKEKNT